MALFYGLLILALSGVQGVAHAAPTTDLQLDKSVDNALPQEGQTIVYTLTLTNNGPRGTNLINVSDPLPAGVTYVSDDGLGTYDSLTGLWTPLQLPAGAVTVLNITAIIDAGTVGNTITNTATIISSNRTDTNPANDTSSVDITVVETFLTMLKSAITISDPVNGTASPYNIPGATLLYSLQTTNSGSGTVDTDSVVVTDSIPANTALYVNDLGTGPILFIDGSAPVNSGLSYTFTSLGSSTDDLEFSSDGGASWNYTPVPDADGYDLNVTTLRINPKGVMRASNGVDNPVFTLRFQVRVQ